MARIEVHSVSMNGTQIQSLNVKIHQLDLRTIDRETAISWMKDGHSLIPIAGNAFKAALQLVESNGDWFIRENNDAIPEDAVVDLNQ